MLDSLSWLREFAALVEANADELTELDAAIGDADHGSNMRRGTAAVLDALSQSPPATAAETTRQTAMVLIRSVGGASGPLYGTFFLRFSAAIEETGLGTAGFAKAFRAGLDGVVTRGKAEAGDKTMYDALAPAAATLDECAAAGTALAEALDRAIAAAQAGSDATVEMVARKGRASYLGPRSIGHRDPGAASAVLLVRAAREALR